ncbi:hypothetical protein [Stenotrophomonas chelatiphaga]|uniref:hypothetical protein n=1 Tax=Stenotrophomonas chelatiphaga TaxID=517011 RepID=UPI00289AF15E|nr:hypothetical protein [Stenotrophomonas chelatiphaga]
MEGLIFIDAEIARKDSAFIIAAPTGAVRSCRVPFHPVPLRRFGTVEAALVVAHLSDGFLYFDDVEEGFEVGVAGEDGILPERSGDQLELQHALVRAGL